MRAVESVNVYPASLGDIVGFGHVITSGSRDDLPVYFVNANVMFKDQTKKFLRTGKGGLRLGDLVQDGTS